MLVLGRRLGETLVIDGPCVIEVVRFAPGSVRLGITAGKEVAIKRGELADGWNHAAKSGAGPILRFVGGLPSDPDIPVLEVGEAACDVDEDGSEIVVENSP